MDRDFARHLTPVLGFWHVVKVTAQALWKKFYFTIFGPAFLTAFPNHQVYFEPPLKVVFEIFAHLSAAFPSFKLELEQLLENPEDQVKNTASSLWFVFNFALPLVGFFFFHFFSPFS